MTKQFVDARDAFYEKLATCFELTLQQFHISRALRIAASRFEQDGRLIFKSAPFVKRIPIVPVEFVNDLVIGNNHSDTDKVTQRS